MIIPETVPPIPLSVIIPALNEEAALPATLAGLARQGDDPRFEIILADGGSSDATAACFLELTRSWEGRGRVARLVTCPRAGRAAQMNMGAAKAVGKALVFLHADTVLPEGGTRAVMQTLEDPAVTGGGFRHAFAERGILLRVISSWSTARSRLTGVHLGDQAMFARRTAFEAAGGFPDVPLFEDLYLSRRLLSAGRTVTLPLAVETSARRLLAGGIVRTALKFAWLRLRLRLGAEAASLKSSYRDVR